ncbi:MAG: hypothetical protein MJ252_24600, partial [archaeon]|nr:hypothetical protein [archaeon]
MSKHKRTLSAEGFSKNLTNVDFTNQKDRVNSPRSKRALLELGIEEDQLYFLTKSEFFKMHPELISSSVELRNRRYEHYDLKRKDRIQRAIEEREKILNRYNSANNLYETGYNQGFIGLDIRDQERFENIKKQNLYEIKNLIDFEVNLEDKRFINEAKLRLQNQKDEMNNQRKKEEQLMRKNIIRQKEIEKEEAEEKERKRQMRRYRRYFIEQQIKRREEEKRQRETQKKFLEKQQENHRKDEEFRNKLEENFQERMHILEIKQHELDLKSNERQKRIDLKREIIARKYLEQSKQREKKLSNAKVKNLQNIQRRIDKYNRKQEAIYQQKEDQKRVKEKEKFETQMKFHEKEGRAFETRNRNAKIQADRRLQLLKRFDENDRRIQTQKELNQRIIDNKNYSNALRRIDAEEKGKEKEMQRKFRNTLKMKGILERQQRAENLQKQKQFLCIQKIKMTDEMKEKKESLIHKVHEIMAKGKYNGREDLYKQIFSKDDLKIIGRSHSSSNLGMTGYNTTNSWRYRSDGFKRIKGSCVL